jgi:hypothetical protein
VKTVTLPVSDCGCFHVGLVGDLVGDIRPVSANGETPQFGVAKTACIAACDAMLTSE